MICGHYIDNYFEKEVRQFCEQAVQEICDNYGFQVVRPSKYRRDLVEIGLMNPDGTINIDEFFKSVKMLYMIPVDPDTNGDYIMQQSIYSHGMYNHNYFGPDEGKFDITQCKQYVIDEDEIL